MYNRKYEKPSSDFIDNIIRNSYKIAQKKPLLTMLSNVFNEFYLPSPKYALSLVFMVGLALSFMMPEVAAQYDELDIYMQGGYDYE